jgi:diguanylate cyclase (GGDEF)-like protein
MERLMSSVPENTIYDSDIKDQFDDTTRVIVQRPVLTKLDDADMSHRYSIDKAEILIGRDMMADVVVNDTRSSRRHVRLEYVNFDQPDQVPEVYVEDLGSTNGSFLNGTRLGKRERLNDRDKILIGSTLFSFSIRDQEELQADQRLLELATTDALTELSNRGMFNREVQKEFDRARRYKRELSIVIFDIDHFKKFNDAYGHQTGDYVLKEIGRLVRLNQRSNDICSRYGGEEFALLLPETSLDGALINAERLRQSVEHNPFKHGDNICKVTISLGLATQEPAMNTCEDLIKAADKALYRSKTDGRNRVSYAQNGELIPYVATVH